MWHHAPRGDESLNLASRRVLLHSEQNLPASRIRLCLNSSKFGFAPGSHLSINAMTPIHSSPTHPHPPEGEVSLADLQRLIRKMYHEKDAARGIEGTFMWFMEE